MTPKVKRVSRDGGFFYALMTVWTGSTTATTTWTGETASTTVTVSVGESMGLLLALTYAFSFTVTTGGTGATWTEGTTAATTWTTN